MKKIYIEITNECNLNCKFCRNTNRPKEKVSLKNFEHIINEVQEHTKLICLHVKGEPLLHSELEQILQLIEKYNLETNITTNGILLNKKAREISKSEVVRQLNISLHSALENDNINISRYMNNIFEAIDNFKNNKIIISYRLWNLKDIKFNKKNTEIINILGEKYKISNLLEILQNNQWYKLDKNTYINQDTQFIWPNLNSKIINDCGRCLALKDQIAILVNGDVVPCCIDSEGEIRLGNIYNEKLNDILESERAKEVLTNFQNNKITEELCKRCGFLNRLENKRK